MAVRSEAWVCSRFIVGIGSSNPSHGNEIRVLCFLCRKRPQRLTDLSCRVILPIVFLCVSVRECVLVCECA